MSSSQTKSICGAKNSTDIVLAADIVEYHNKGYLLCLVKCLWGEAIHLLYSGLLHALLFIENEWQTNSDELFVRFDIDDKILV